MTRVAFYTALAFMAFFVPARAQDVSDKDAFVEANILSIFYHEFGHAVIDLMEVPIFGQEEDAADVMSVLLIDWLFEEDAAQAIAYDSAFGYINDPEGEAEIAYWDVHGPDEQRYYNHVCLFFGADPEFRSDLASDLGLPEERAEYCPDEYALAADSWGAVFDAMDAQKSGEPIVFEPAAAPSAALINRMLSAEVANMNHDLRLPQQLTVKVSDCDEPNAFYDPEEVSITFCTEFIPHLEQLHDMIATE